MIATLTAALFALLLVAGMPLLSYSTGRNPHIRELPRRDLYFSAALSQWLVTAAGAGIVWWAAPQVFASGFRRAPLGPTLAWAVCIAGAALVGLAAVIFCERRGWLPREPDLIHFLIPQTRQEKLWAALLVATTAACCEEFLFRGFLLAELRLWSHSAGWAWFGSSVAFGLAHSYQGLSGMARAALLGALLAWPVVALGSLYAAMLAHWMIDAAALVYLGPRMLRD